MPPLIISGKAEKIGKQGGRQSHAVRLPRAVADDVEAELAVAAFDLAVASRRPAAGCRP